MGDLLFKMGVLGLVLVTLLLGFTNGASIPECCKEKMVGGVSYVLKEETDTERYGCKSNCVFERVGSPGSKYCFKEGDLEVVCEDDDNGGGGPGPSPVPTPSPAPPSPAAPSPSAGRTCPARSLADNCNINCGNTSPECTGQNSGNSFSSSSNSINGVDTFATSWTVLEGSEGATCRLNCKAEDNLDVTTTCSWNGQEMEWSRPEKLVAKCGGN